MIVLLKTREQAFQNSVSHIGHSVPHRFNNKCWRLNPFHWVKKTNVTMRNAKLCLCGLTGHASPSDRVDGSTRNRNTGERHYISYGTMPLSASRSCLKALTLPQTSTPLSVQNSCRCLVQNRGCIHFTTDANKRHPCPEPTHLHVPTNETTRRQCNA